MSGRAYPRKAAEAAVLAIWGEADRTLHARPLKRKGWAAPQHHQFRQSRRSRPSVMAYHARRAPRQPVGQLRGRRSWQRPMVGALQDPRHRRRRHLHLGRGVYQRGQQTRLGQAGLPRQLPVRLRALRQPLLGGGRSAAVDFVGRPRRTVPRAGRRAGTGPQRRRGLRQPSTARRAFRCGSMARSR